VELFAPEPPYFSERKKQDFIRYFQSLDTDSCELIVIDPRGGPIFAQDTILCQRNSDRASAHIFGWCFCISRRPWLAYDGKRAKVLSMANRGMGVAVDIIVIPEQVIDFLPVSVAVRSRSLGGEFIADGTKVQYRAQGAPPKVRVV
jgi:hypothetical protein